MSQVNRRDFLSASAAAGLLAATPNLFGTPTLAAENKATALKLGLVTYNWGKDWDLPTILENCAATGFAGVELRSTHKHGVEIDLDAKARDEVRARFADSPVECVGLGSACEYHAADPAVVQNNIEETAAFVQLCHDIGGTGVKVRPNGLPKNVPVEKTLEQIGRSLNIVGKHAADFGVQIRVEVHGRGTSEIPHMKTIMDIADHPNVAVCWNCNAADLDGPGFEHNFNLLEDRLGTVHIHDLTTPSYPWEPLFAELNSCTAAPFTGWALLEDGNMPNDIVAAMHANKKRFDQLAKA